MMLLLASFISCTISASEYNLKVLELSVATTVEEVKVDDIPVAQISDFEYGLFEYLEANAADSLASIVSEGAISDETAENLEKAFKDYKAGFNA